MSSAPRKEMMSSYDWRARFLADAADQDLAQRVCGAIEQLLRDDRYLLEHDANERSISHHLGCYLQARFQGWHVDCEYNRDGHDPKRLQLGAEAGSGTSVFPDIIVHKRGEEGPNLLAIEIKKNSGESPEGDQRKLSALRRELNYSHTLFLLFEAGDRMCGLLRWEWSAPEASQ